MLASSLVSTELAGPLVDYIKNFKLLKANITEAPLTKGRCSAHVPSGQLQQMEDSPPSSPACPPSSSSQSQVPPLLRTHLTAQKRANQIPRPQVLRQTQFSYDDAVDIQGLRALGWHLRVIRQLLIAAIRAASSVSASEGLHCTRRQEWLELDAGRANRFVADPSPEPQPVSTW